MSYAFGFLSVEDLSLTKEENWPGIYDHGLVWLNAGKSTLRPDKAHFS